MIVIQLLFLAELAVFYGAYFAKRISQKKRGIQTMLIAKGKKGRVLYVECLLGVATTVLPAAEVVFIVLGKASSAALLCWLGLALCTLGNAVFITAMLTMRDSWRAGVTEEKTALVTQGVYEFSRNPAFLGFDLVYIGVLLGFWNPPLFLLTVFAVTMLHLQIIWNEEPAMIGHFGESYKAYQKRVCRYLGKRA